QAPERNREHSIGDQVSALNVGFMERLRNNSKKPLNHERHRPGFVYSPQDDKATNQEEKRTPHSTPT
ncbi:hypothetical protein, partial [Pseudomonas mosselii]|uniref:hypothetical protein n=1 Tax=Pseudomonas mosselii TaxID=78327 RepID=UPI001EE1BD70